MRTFVITAFLLLLGLFSFNAKAETCTADRTCVGCNLTGRAYLLIKPYCTVCTAFCLPPASTKPGETGGSSKIIPTKEEILFLSVPPEIVQSIGCTNPEAAQMLLLMGMRSQDASNSMPTAGEGNATKLVSCNAVFASLKDPKGTDISSMLIDIPAGKGSYSRVTWALERTSDSSGVLHLQHRLLDAQRQPLSSLYPDIDVAVAYVHEGQARYWKAMSWKAIQ